MHSHFLLFLSTFASQIHCHLIQKSSYDVLIAEINSSPSSSFLTSEIILGEARFILSLLIYYFIGGEPSRQNSLVCKKDQMPGAAEAPPQISMQTGSKAAA